MRGGHDGSTSTSEPRCGQRNAIAATIERPTSSGAKRPTRLVALHTENKSNAKVRLAQYDHVLQKLVVPGQPTIAAGDLNTVSPGEGSAFRTELASRTQRNGRARSMFDCSRGDDTTTFSAALVVRLRIDWMLVQSGEGDVLDCAPGSYKVNDSEGASDHKPVVTNFTLAQRPERPERSEGRDGKVSERSGSHQPRVVKSPCRVKLATSASGAQIGKSSGRHRVSIANARMPVTRPPSRRTSTTEWPG